MSDVRTLLKKRPLLFDGGMGTYYKGAPAGNVSRQTGWIRRASGRSTAPIWRREPMPSRRIPSACPAWRRLRTRSGRH